jgi:hypothetical protein
LVNAHLETSLVSIRTSPSRSKSFAVPWYNAGNAANTSGLITSSTETVLPEGDDINMPPVWVCCGVGSVQGPPRVVLLQYVRFLFESRPLR